MTGVDVTFLDTNVLVYAYDRAEPVKGPSAQLLLAQLFAAGRPVVSVQVLSEFFWTVTRKLAVPLSQPDAEIEVRRLQKLTNVIGGTWPLLDRALQTVATQSISIWDALIHAAAHSAGAAVLLSEDMQHRSVIDGIKILNPFASDFDPDEILNLLP